MTGAFSLQNTKESSLHAFILDDSFSMQGNEEIIKINSTFNDWLKKNNLKNS